MDTRTIAIQFRKFADFLDSRPEFELDYGVHVGSDITVPFYDKEKFLEAAKALGNAKKSYTEGEYAQFRLTAEEFPLSLSISRDKVCTKKIVYDCQPMFSAEEMEEL